MNNIFKKNIESIYKKNPDFATRIAKHIPNDMPKLIAENNFYNFEYKGIKIHNPQNPLAEAQEIFSYSENTPVAIHLIYGLGLGYLFKVAAEKSTGTVILYEPDLNILFSAFNVVDFSSDFAKNNVYITDNFEDLSQIIYTKSGTENSPQMLILPSQREFEKDNLGEFIKNLQDLIGSYSLDLKYTKEQFYPALKMLITNIPHLTKEIPLIKFKDIFKEKTALIVSAGPTLDRNIETIKKYRENFILFTVGTAFKTLQKHGIEPDFLSIIETYDSSKQIADYDLSKINFITEPYSNPKLRNFKFKQTFSHISANMPINHFWSEICGENIEEYWSKGTVSYNALNSARILGCSKIILVGQDLAYIEGQCYSKNSAYKDLVCRFNNESQKWEITANNMEKFADSLSNAPTFEERIETAKRRLKKLNASLYYVKGINGDLIPTESVYAAFVKPLSEFALHFNDRTYINTSLVGAQIDGFKNMSLEEALADSEKNGLIEFKTDFTYDKNSIKSKLLDSKKLLNQSLPEIEEIKHLIKNLNNNLKRQKNLEVDSLKILKKISEKYLYLTSTFSNQSKLFDFITADGKINLDYQMKMLKDLTNDSVTTLIQNINNFADTTINRINEVNSLLDNSIKELE